jgi:integrase
MARHGDGIYQRGKTWWLDFTFRGERHIVRLGSHIARSAARELAAVRRAEILKGEAGIGGRPRADATWERAVEEFRQKIVATLRPGTQRTYAHELKMLSGFFKGHRLSEITPFLVEKYKRGRVEAGARVGFNRERSLLRALFNRCREWGLFVGENPVTAVKRFKESSGRLRVLDPDEEIRLLGALPGPYRLLALVGLDAGLRLNSEALPLAWGDVDLRLGVLTVPAAYAKNGHMRSVPLTARLRAALEAHRAAAGEPAADAAVFTTRRGAPLRSLRSVFQRAAARAGLPGMSPHVLRHTFASRAAMSGCDLRTLQELGGWGSLSMVQRYAHPAAAHKAEAIARLEAYNSPTGFLQPGKVVALTAREA